MTQIARLDSDLQRAVIEALFSLSRWKSLEKPFAAGERKQILIEAVMPTLLEKMEQLNDVADFTKTAFTMSHFHEICKRRNIETETGGTSKWKRIQGKNLQGFYLVGKSIDYIWIRGGLSVGYRRFVAAHEVSHFCLHRETLLNHAVLPATACLRNTDTNVEVAEFEADLMALVMISRKAEVKTV